MRPSGHHGHVAEVLEGGDGDGSGGTRWGRGLRLAAGGAAAALLAWYVLNPDGTGPPVRAPGPVLPGPPAAAAGPAPVDAVVSVAEGGFPDGTVLARIGPGREERVEALHGTLIDLPNGVDPCAVPSDGTGRRSLLHTLWRAGVSRPAARPVDLSGASRTVEPFLQVLGYRGEQVWIAEGSAPGAPDASVRVRRGIGTRSHPPAFPGDRTDEPHSVPVALLDSMRPPDRGGPVVTGVVYADGPDPTLPRAEGYDLRVDWPKKRGAAFHVDVVLGYGPDSLVAVDHPCDGGACGLTVLQANRGTAVVRQGVTLPEGWVVPDPTATGRIAFAGDGFVLVVRTHDGRHTALAYADPYTGRAGIVPGSRGAVPDGASVAASGPDVLFTVDGHGDGRARLAHWDSTTGERARLLTGGGVGKADRLVCAVPGGRG